MNPSLDIVEFLSRAKSLPVVDVRSPAEYSRGHIPGATNIPLFNNEERAAVGIRYKQESRRAAILEGLDIVGPKMTGFVKQATSLAGHHGVLVYCWRGGMRSSSMSWLFQTAGIPAQTLAGGYRSYRRHVHTVLAEPARLWVLGGMTGSGKTAVLRELGRSGIQVIDLEELASHKGSAFGALGQDTQPSTEQFENNLYTARAACDTSRIIVVEDESKSIGSVQLPDELYLQMRAAPVVVLEVPLEARIERLVREYAGYPKQALAEALTRIRKKLGGARLQEALRALEQQNFREVAKISLEYYDKTYTYGLSRREPHTRIPFPVDADQPVETANRLVVFLHEQEAGD